MKSLTDRARSLLKIAAEEVNRLNQECIGPEHLLMALAKDEGSIAAAILRRLKVSRESILEELSRLVQGGPERQLLTEVPQSPAAKRVLQFAEDEVGDGKFIGTEQILLGLLRETGIAHDVLSLLLTHSEVVGKRDYVEAVRETTEHVFVPVSAA